MEDDPDVMEDDLDMMEDDLDMMEDNHCPKHTPQPPHIISQHPRIFPNQI